ARSVFGPRVVAARCIFACKNNLAALAVGTSRRNLRSLEAPLTSYTLARKKTRNRESLLTRSIIIRVNEGLFKRLEKLQRESDCSSVAEVVRRIISRRRINCFYRDISMNGPMEELALIRKELKAIGININQQTRFFHTSATTTERSFYA